MIPYREQQPSKRLARYIKCFWSLKYESLAVIPDVETVLPDGCPEIIFNLSDRFKRLHSDFEEIQAATLFSGQLIRNIAIRPTGRVCLFGVRFHPAGAFPIGRFSMHELTDEVIGIDNIFGSAGFELEDVVNEAGSFQERIAVFEAFFLKRLAAQRQEDNLAFYAANMIVGSGGTISVSKLGKTLGVAERRLERRFKSRIGVSPKMLARIVRFQNVVKSIQKSESATMLDAALDFGYFDQSHMIREFKEFSGETPLAYFERTHRISDIFTASG